MRDQHALDQLSAFISGDLDDISSRRVEEHLAKCEACKREYMQLSRVWEGLGRLPEEEPGEALTDGFYNMLKGYQQAAQESRGLSARLRGAGSTVRSWFAFPAFQGAFAVVMLLIGLLVGRFLSAGNGDAREVAQLRGEVRQLGNLLTVSLLQQESASERLKGVSWSQKTGGNDAEIQDALIQTMKYDPNVNVRLAALDALTHDVNQPHVRQEESSTASPRRNPPSCRRRS